MNWADVGAVLFGFLVFTGVGASSAWLAMRTRGLKSREHAKLDWLDVLDAFEGTPPLRMEAAFSRPSAAPLRRRA